jgi:hypothetical protein
MPEVELQDDNPSPMHQSVGAFSLIAVDSFLVSSSFFNRNKYVRATTAPLSDSLDCASWGNET